MQNRQIYVDRKHLNDCLGLGVAAPGGPKEGQLVGQGFLFLGDVLQIGCSDGCTTLVTRLKTIELYRLNGWIVYFVNRISIKLLKI